MSVDRRAVLAGLASGATVVAAPRLGWTAPRFSDDPFSLGVASGDPTSDGVVLWTRLAPRPLDPDFGMSADPIDIRWVVAADPRLTAVVTQGRVVARSADAHAIHVEVSGLQPGREYFYAFEAVGHRSPIGRTKTAPAPGGADAVRLGVIGCNRYEDGYFNAYAHVAGQALDLVFHYGDYIYEYRAVREGERTRPVVRDMPGMPGAARTLADYRNRYAIYKSDPDLQAAHASVPFVVSFDDHEVEDDWAGDHPGRPSADPAAFLARRAAAFRAWYEHMPVRRSQRPNGPALLMHRRIGIGDLATLHVLDTRQHRSPQLCGNGWQVCPEAADARRTMLGAAQERWLAEGLRASPARWAILAQQVPVMPRERPAGGAMQAHMDKWDGAPAARDRLLAAVSAAGTRNAIVLSGDVHENWAGVLNRGEGRSTQPAGVEFVTTSATSNGDGSAAISRAAQALLDANPHLAFHNAQRGYTVHSITPRRWEATYWVCPRVSARSAEARRLARFVVPDGAARLERD